MLLSGMATRNKLDAANSDGCKEQAGCCYQ